MGDLEASAGGDRARVVHLAAQHGHVAVLAYAKDHSVDLLVADKEGSAPLHRAAMQGHWTVMDYLVGEGGSAWDSPDVRRGQGHSTSLLPRGDFSRSHFSLTGVLIS